MVNYFVSEIKILVTNRITLNQGKQQPNIYLDVFVTEVVKNVKGVYVLRNKGLIWRKI